MTKSTTIILDQNNRDLLFTLGVLNSRLISFWYSADFKSLSLAGGHLRINHNKISKIPIRDIDGKIKDKISTNVLEVVNAKSVDPYADTSNYEHQIDHLVYQLYGLNEEEIEVVNGSIKPNDTAKKETTIFDHIDSLAELKYGDHVTIRDTSELQVEMVNAMTDNHLCP